VAVERVSGDVLDEDAVKRIVQDRIAEYGQEIEQMIDSAVKRNLRASASVSNGAAARREDVLRAEKTIADAFSCMRHVISVAYVPREDYWLLFIIHDSDRRGDVTEQIANAMVRAEDLPSVPLLDARIRHVSGTTHAPPEAKVLFAKR